MNIFLERQKLYIILGAHWKRRMQTIRGSNEIYDIHGFMEKLYNHKIKKRGLMNWAELLKQS